MRIVALLAVVLLSFSGCAFFFNISGRVISGNSGLPMAGVRIEEKNSGKFVYTDAQGNFTLVCSRSWLNTTARLVFTREHFKPFEIDIEDDDESSTYKVHRESEFYKFSAPVHQSENSYVIGTYIELKSMDFQVRSDSLIVTLDSLDIKEELIMIQKKLKE